MNTKAHEANIKNHQRFCKHYTGLFGPGLVEHKECKIGIKYDDVKVTRNDGRGINYPCAKEGKFNSCHQAEYPTREEAELALKESYEHIAKYFEHISQGNCPHCDKPMTKRQIGHCVYAEPCGHRLYQGSIKG